MTREGTPLFALAVTADPAKAQATLAMESIAPSVRLATLRPLLYSLAAKVRQSVRANYGEMWSVEVPIGSLAIRLKRAEANTSRDPVEETQWMRELLEEIARGEGMQ